MRGRKLLVSGASSVATARGGSALADARGRVEVVPGGAVLAVDGVVTWVGPERDAPADAADAERLDARGGTVVPGFVDAHSHAVHAGDRADEMRLRLAGATYQELSARGGGIASTVRATRAASLEQLVDLTAARLRRLALHGATTVEVKSGYGLDIETELRQLRAARAAGVATGVAVVPTYLGAHAVPPDGGLSRAQYLDVVAFEALPRVAEEGLARFCDAWCDAGAFTPAETRRVLEGAAALGLGLKLHADQMAPSGGAELAAELRATSADHLLHATDAGLRAMADAGVVAVLLPASALFLGARAPEAARFRAAGCAMAVATDLNPGSSPTENVALGVALACLRSGMDPDEAFVAVTLNGAAAVGLAATKGTIEPGKDCDLAVLDAPSHDHLAYRLGTNVVRHVVASGRVLVRDGRWEGQPTV